LCLKMLRMQCRCSMKDRKHLRINFEQQLEGMVVLGVEEPEFTKILSLLSAEKISLFHVRTEKNRLYFTIYLNDFNAVQKLLRSHHIRFHIYGKRGVPFYISRLKRRKGLWLGLLGCILLWQIAGSFIWGYTVSGNEHYSDEHIIALVQAYGLWPGTFSSSIDFEKLEYELEMEHPEFTWIQLDLLGTTLCISVKERLSEKADLQSDGSIVAKADAQITELLMFTGTPLVEVGEWVRAGQVLIGGWDYPERIRSASGEFVDVGEPYAVRAKGNVRGQTVHRAIGSCGLEESWLAETGTIAYGTDILWQEHCLISTGAEKSPYTYSDDEIVIKSLLQWGRWQCPVKIRTKTYHEQIVVHRSFSKEEAYQTAVERARRQLQMEMPMEGVLIRESSGMCRAAQDGTLQAEVVWIVEEPIGQMQQISLPAEHKTE